MPNVIPFTPRPRPAVPTPVQPFAGLDLRVQLEEAAQTALDAADKIIAALDRIEEDPAATRIAADTSPTTTVPSTEPATIPQEVAVPPEPIIVAALETPPAEVSVSAEEPSGVGAPPARIVHEPLRWYGAGNVVSALGIAVLALVVRA